MNLMSAIPRIMSDVLKYEYYAFGKMFVNARYLSLFLVISFSSSALYMILLPSLPFGRIVISAVRFITPLQLFFSLIFGILLGLAVTLNVYSVRFSTHNVRSLTIASVLSSMVNGLCCTPAIPFILSLGGASTPLLYSISPRIQAFFEFNYPYFYAASILMLTLSIHYLSCNIACCIRR